MHGAGRPSVFRFDGRTLAGRRHRFFALPQTKHRLAGRSVPVLVAAQRALARGLLTLGQYKSATLEAIMPVESTQLVDDVMRQWPATIRFFLNHKMRCVGCPIACFHTVDDASASFPYVGTASLWRVNSCTSCPFSRSKSRSERKTSSSPPGC